MWEEVGQEVCSEIWEKGWIEEQEDLTRLQLLQLKLLLLQRPMYVV